MLPIELGFDDLGHEWFGLIAPLAGLAVLTLVTTLLLLVDLRLDLWLGGQAGRVFGQLKGHLRSLAHRATRVHPQPVPGDLPPIAADETWPTPTEAIETSADRLRAIGALHERARQSIEAAEYALDRLIAEGGTVLPTREAIAHALPDAAAVQAVEPLPIPLAA